jgi:hypothetical protein
LNWVRFHTRLLVRATEWDHKNKEQSFHLFGKDLEEVEFFLKSNVGKEPALTPLQMSYITSSQSGAIELQKKQLKGFYLSAFIYSLLQMVVIYFWSFDNISEDGLVKLSWVWLPALSFSLAGFTIGKRSLKISFIAVIVVSILFFLFYNLIWPSL